LKPQLSINVPVWGSDYISTFTKYCLPAHLADGNLPEIRSRVFSYNIFTKRQNLNELQASESFRILRQTVSYKIIFIDSISDLKADKYSLNSSVFRFALNQAYNKSAGCILLNSDHLISEKTFSCLIKLIDSGIRLIEIPGPRTDLESVSSFLIKKTKRNKLSITSHELLSLWYKNMHQDLKFHFVDGKENGINPSHLYWDIKRFGVVARCCHLFPCAIVPCRKISKNFITVDDNLTKNYKFNKNNTLIEKNANRFFICELSRRGSVMGPSAEKTNINSFFKFFDRNSAKNLKRYQTEILLSKERIHRSNPVRSKSLHYVESLLKKYKHWKKAELKSSDKTYKANFIYKDKFDLPDIDTPFLYFCTNTLIGDKLVFYDHPYQLHRKHKSNFKAYKFSKKIHRDIFKAMLKIAQLTLPVRFLANLLNAINPNLVRLRCAHEYFNNYKRNNDMALICQNPFLSPGTLIRVLSDQGSSFMASKTGRSIQQNKQLKKGLERVFGEKSVEMLNKSELDLDLIGIPEESMINIVKNVQDVPLYKIDDIGDKGLFEDVVLHAVYYNILK